MMLKVKLKIELLDVLRHFIFAVFKMYEIVTKYRIKQFCKH